MSRALANGTGPIATGPVPLVAPVGRRRRCGSPARASVTSSSAYSPRTLQIHSQDIREPQQIGENIGHLLANPPGASRLHHDVGGFIGREPLKDLRKLTHLASKRHYQILRRVKLLPVTLDSKVPELTLQARDGHPPHIARTRDCANDPGRSRRQSDHAE